MFGFTGQIYNQEVGASGSYLYRMRWYDPELGRFLSRDPAGYIDGMLLYAYVSGNPMLLVDPLGLWSIGGWWRDVCDGTKGLFGGMDKHVRVRDDLTAAKAEIFKRLITKGKMSPEQAKTLLEELGHRKARSKMR